MKILIQILVFWAFSLISHAPCSPPGVSAHRLATIQKTHHTSQSPGSPAVFDIHYQAESSANLTNRLPGQNLSAESQHLHIKDRLVETVRRQSIKRLFVACWYYQRKLILKKLIFPFHTYL